MEEKSSNVMIDFLKQFESKNEKSMFGKIINKIRKREDKAKSKAAAVALMIEEPLSDFDY